MKEEEETLEEVLSDILGPHLGEVYFAPDNSRVLSYKYSFLPPAAPINRGTYRKVSRPSKGDWVQRDGEVGWILYIDWQEEDVAVMFPQSGRETLDLGLFSGGDYISKSKRKWIML